MCKNGWNGFSVKKLISQDDRETTTETKAALKLATYNCRSIVNKTTGVLEHINETDTDICFIQETFLKKKDTAKLAEIRDYGYEVISAPRHRCGGGIAIVYRQGIPLQQNRKIEKFNTFEVMEATLDDGEQLWRFVNIYRAPYSKKHRFTILHFLDEFDQYLSLVRSKNGNPIIVGDFNIHVEKEDDINSIRFQNLLTEFQLVQHVPHVATHNEGGTLDLVLTDSHHDVTGLEIIKFIPVRTIILLV